MSCTIRVNKHGNLCLRLFWQGREWQERVTNRGRPARDNTANRKRVEARAQLINEEMEAGTFDYLKWFPNGNKAHLFRPNEINPPAEAKPQTVKQRFDAWIETKKPPFVRRSLERDYRQAFSKHVIPFMGDIELPAVAVETLESFRLYLVEDCTVKLKTARNVIDGPLRAFFRDSRRYLQTNPFDDLPPNWWPRQKRLEPDPFTEGERDAILKFYRTNRRYRDYALVQFRFYTGTRPSEAVALKWAHVDLQSGKAIIASSRTFGEDNDTKTRASRRTITLLPNVAETLRRLQPLHCEPDSYVFTDESGRPVDQNEFGRKFTGVLRVLKLRLRRFYNTRHTFISVALTIGCNQKWIAEQTGTSIAMIQQNYGKCIRDDGDALLRAYVGDAVQAFTRDENEVKTGTFAGTLLSGRVNYATRLVVPAGIEPALPT